MSTTQVTPSPGITFAVDDVEPCTQPGHTIPMYESLRKKLRSDIESCSSYREQVLFRKDYQALLAAVYTAYSHHQPLILSPDVIWLTIEQGIAHHMMVNGERLRSRFVRHSGQINLVIRRDDFIEGSPENDWQGCFDEWCQQIRNYVGSEMHSCLECNFSTTGPVERAASHIVMMDIFRRYFRYVALCVCGIPTVTLRGTPDDWTRLRNKVEGLERFDIDWWLQELRPICDQFVRASEGDIDLPHWQSICKLREQYGGAEINGWIAKMFPYIREYPEGLCTRKNPVFEKKGSMTTLNAPSGLSQVPFWWVNTQTGLQRPMEAIGGLLGVKQNPETLALEPVAGWAVRRVDGFDATLALLLKEHEVICQSPEPVEAVRSSQPNTRRVESIFPTDYDHFYFAVTSATIRNRCGSAIRIVSRDQTRNHRWDDATSDNSIVSDFDHVWQTFAWTDRGQQIAIYLDRNRVNHDSRYERKISYDTFAPICLTSDRTQGKPGKNPVIALSLTEFLARSLHWARSDHADESGRYFWESESFSPEGDAFDFM